MLPGTEALLRSLLARGPEIFLRDATQAVAGPQATQPVAPVANDTGLPSRAALERELPARAAGKAVREVPVSASAPTTSGAEAPVSAAPASLSAGARALAALLAPAPAQQEAPQPPPVRGASPLWPRTEAPVAAELAKTLERTVGQSGLFYESHLEELARGTRTLEQLQREPQARAAATASTPAPGEAPVVVHPATTVIVQQQLELLASGLFRWTGEPWAGAHMEWEVGAEPEGADGAPAPGRAWNTRLQVTLPVLGTVDAHVQLEADGVLRVRVAASDAAALGRLQEARAALVQRFASAGLSLAACRVEAA